MANSYEYALAEAMMRRCQLEGIKVHMPEGPFAARCEVDFETMEEENQDICHRLMDVAVEEIIQREPWMFQSKTAEITLEATPVMVNRDLMFRNSCSEIGFTCRPVAKQLVTLYPLHEDFLQRLTGYEVVDDITGQVITQRLEDMKGMDWTVINPDKIAILYPIKEWIVENLNAIQKEHGDVAEKLIRNAFIGQSVYEVIPDLKDISVSIEGCNTDRSAMPDYTPYPSNILSIRDKRQKNGKILRHVQEIVMDKGWMISFRLGTCRPKVEKMGISVIFQLTGMPYGMWRKLIRI